MPDPESDLYRILIISLSVQSRAFGVYSRLSHRKKARMPTSTLALLLPPGMHSCVHTKGCMSSCSHAQGSPSPLCHTSKTVGSGQCRACLSRYHISDATACILVFHYFNFVRDEVLLGPQPTGWRPGKV
jgi:hypothetical protein